MAADPACEDCVGNDPLAARYYCYHFRPHLDARDPHMPRYSLETIILILIILWLLGAFIAPFGGDLIHLLLVVVLIVVVLRLLQGRRVV